MRTVTFVIISFWEKILIHSVRYFWTCYGRFLWKTIWFNIRRWRWFIIVHRFLCYKNWKSIVRFILNQRIQYFQSLPINWWLIEKWLYNIWVRVLNYSFLVTTNWLETSADTNKFFSSEKLLKISAILAGITLQLWHVIWGGYTLQYTWIDWIRMNKKSKALSCSQLNNG